MSTDSDYGCILARAQAAAVTIDDGLGRYQERRRARAEWVALQSRAATQLYQTTVGNKSEERARTADTLYQYDATTVPL